MNETWLEIKGSDDKQGYYYLTRHYLVDGIEFIRHFAQGSLNFVSGIYDTLCEE